MRICGISKEKNGMTLMELVIAMGISAVIISVVVVFCSNIILQYNEQKQSLKINSEAAYLLEVFNSIKSNPSVRVRSDNKAVEVSNTNLIPESKIIFYELENSVYKDVYEDSQYKNTLLVAKGFSVNFSLDSNASYLKDILKLEVTDQQGQIWNREVSLRDCDIIGIY